MQKKTVAAEAKAAPKKSVLDALLEKAPESPTFSIQLGEQETLVFNRPRSYSEIAKAKRLAAAKAKESYYVVTGQDKDLPADPDKLDALTSCFLMNALAADKAEVKVSTLFALAERWGGVFGGLVQSFNVMLVTGEAQAFNDQVNDSKND